MQKQEPTTPRHKTTHRRSQKRRDQKIPSYTGKKRQDKQTNTGAKNNDYQLQKTFTADDHLFVSYDRHLLSRLQESENRILLKCTETKTSLQHRLKVS